MNLIHPKPQSPHHNRLHENATSFTDIELTSRRNRRRCSPAVAPFASAVARQRSPRARKRGLTLSAQASPEWATLGKGTLKEVRRSGAGTGPIFNLLLRVEFR